MRRFVQTLFALAFSTLAQAAAAAPGVPNGPPAPPTAPLNPVSYSLQLSNNAYFAVGGGADGILNVTSIIFTNLSSTTQTIYVVQASTSGPGCSGSVTATSNTPINNFKVPAEQTIQLTFPTALRVPHFNGVSCLSFAVLDTLNGGYVSVLVTGLLTYKNGS